METVRLPSECQTLLWVQTEHTLSPVPRRRLRSSTLRKGEIKDERDSGYGGVEQYSMRTYYVGAAELDLFNLIHLSLLPLYYFHWYVCSKFFNLKSASFSRGVRPNLVSIVCLLFFHSLLYFGV